MSERCSFESYTNSVTDDSSIVLYTARRYLYLFHNASIAITVCHTRTTSMHSLHDCLRVPESCFLISALALMTCMNVFWMPGFSVYLLLL